MRATIATPAFGHQLHSVQTAQERPEQSISDCRKNSLASGGLSIPDPHMQLNDEQKQKVAAWIAEGMKLSDIQIRLGEEFGIRLTYMDTRLLVDDLKLMPKDPPQAIEPKAPEEPAAPAAEPAAPAAPAELSPLSPDAPAPPAGAGKVSLSVDTLARPGTIVSGSVTFTDGKKAAWYLDQTGRLGVVPETQGYRPPAGDVEEFQAALDRELAKMGY
jgi:hypothetical protein